MPETADVLPPERKKQKRSRSQDTRPDVVAALEAQRARAEAEKATATGEAAKGQAEDEQKDIQPQGGNDVASSETVPTPEPPTADEEQRAPSLKGFYYDTKTKRYYPADQSIAREKRAAAVVAAARASRSQELKQIAGQPLRSAVPVRGLSRRRGGPRASLLSFVKNGGSSRMDLFMGALATAQPLRSLVDLGDNGGLLEPGVRDRFFRTHPQDPMRLAFVQYASDRYFTVKEFTPRATEDGESYSASVTVSQPQRAEFCGDILHMDFLPAPTDMDGAILALIRNRPGVYIKLELFEVPKEGSRELMPPTRTMMRDTNLWMSGDLIRTSHLSSDGEQQVRTYMGGEQGIIRVDDFMLSGNYVLSHSPRAHATLPGIQSDVLALRIVRCESEERVVVGLRNGTILVVAMDVAGRLRVLREIGRVASPPVSQLLVANSFPSVVIASDQFGGVTAFHLMDLDAPMHVASERLESAVERVLVPAGPVLLHEAPKMFLVQGTMLMRSAMGAHMSVAIVSDEHFFVYGLPEQRLMVSRPLAPNDPRPMLEIVRSLEDDLAPDSPDKNGVVDDPALPSRAALQFFSMTSDGDVFVEEYGSLLSTA
eukprot:scaffold1740_cov254-Pinguiococcus_pyrenoidosus.AAC.19